MSIRFDPATPDEVKSFGRVFTWPALHCDWCGRDERVPKENLTKPPAHPAFRPIGERHTCATCEGRVFDSILGKPACRACGHKHVQPAYCGEPDFSQGTPLGGARCGCTVVA